MFLFVKRVLGYRSENCAQISFFLGQKTALTGSHVKQFLIDEFQIDPVRALPH